MRGLQAQRTHADTPSIGYPYLGTRSAHARGVCGTDSSQNTFGTTGARWRPLLDPSWLSILLEGVSFPAALWSGAELRFKWTNRAFLDLLDDPRPQYDLLGMPVRGFLSDTSSAVRFIDVAYTGQAFTDPEYEFRASWGETTYWQLNYLPVPGHLGDPFDVLLTAVDVTAATVERRRRAAEEADLRHASELIDTTVLSSLDAEDILQRVLIEASEALGSDWGWIAQREDGLWVFRNVHGWPMEMVGLAFEEDDLSLPALIGQEHRLVYAGSRSDASPDGRTVMSRHDVGAFLLVPIVRRGLVTGVMGFCWDAPTEMTEPMVTLARKLQTSLALALENAAAYEAERAVSRTLRSAFFSAPGRIPGLELGHLYHSASGGPHVGGDFYDVVPLAGGQVGVMVGEITGRVGEVAALTALMKSSMRGEALRLPAPGAVLERANEIMLHGADAGEYASAFFGLLDTASGRLAYSLAGHPAPVLCRSGEPPAFLPSAQVVLGADRSSRYETAETVLDPGDLLVLYTSGLTETRDARGRRYGAQRLLEAVAATGDRPAGSIPEHLFLSAFSFSDGMLSDDMAVVAMRRTGEGGGAVQERLALEVGAA